MKRPTSTSQLVWLGTVVVLLFSQAALAKGLPKQAKKQVEERYKKGKMAGWGADAGSFKEWGTVLVAVKRLPMRADLSMGDIFKVSGPFPVEVDIRDSEIIKRGEYTHEVDPGTILGILDLKTKDDRIELSCRTAEPAHQVQRLGGIYAGGGQKSFERTTTKLRFFFDEATMESGDLDHIYTAIESWVKPFPTLEDAIAFASTLGTREISLGMTIAEIESVLGPPETKISLGEKVIYKYEGMAVEFVDGKVADVKF